MGLFIGFQSKKERNKMFGLVYFLACLFIAIMGVNKKFGFWGYLFGSLLLTPVIGFLLIISAGENKPKEKN